MCFWKRWSAKTRLLLITFSKTLLHPWIIHRWFRKSHFLKIQTLRKKRVRAIIWSFIFTQSNSSFVCLFCFLFAWKWLNPECQRCWMSAQNYISQGCPFKKFFFLKSLCLFQHSKATLIKAWLTYFSSVVFPQRAFVHKESDSRSKSNSVASDSTQRIINKMLRLTPQTSKSLYFTENRLSLHCGLLFWTTYLCACIVLHSIQTAPMHCHLCVCARSGITATFKAIVCFKDPEIT